MIERVSYIADDGTTFEEEDECLEYERTLMLKKYERDIHMWDSEFQPIPITDSRALDKVYYLACDTAEAVEVMNNWFEYMGYPSPFESDKGFAEMAGRHYYWQDDDEWHEADYFIEKVRGMMKIFGV